MSDERVCFGSDNGKSSSLVFLKVSDGSIAYLEPYSTGKRMHELLSMYKPVYAATEEVFMSPGFRAVASTGFQILGRYQQSFELLDIPYESIRAVSWRKYLGIKAKGRDQQKEAAIERCKQEFSITDQQYLMSDWTHIVDHHRVTEKVYDNNKCESALIALYALRKWREQNDIAKN